MSVCIRISDKERYLILTFFFMIDFYILIEVSLFVSLKGKKLLGKKEGANVFTEKVDLVSQLYWEDWGPLNLSMFLN